MSTNDNLVVPTFRNEPFLDENATRKAGRPIYQDREVCEIRFAANRQTVAVFPAHEAEPNATRERGETVTYAQVYNTQYIKFKNLQQQTVDGTPLSELPFLTEARRRELRALNVHTAEALAALDGQPLKQLGMDGRPLKTQAQAYLDNARGSADVTSLSRENAELRQMVLDQQRLLDQSANKPQMQAVEPEDVEDEVSEEAPADEGDKPLEDCTSDELKAYIKRETGSAPRGQPNKETLYNMAMEIATTPKDQRQ